MNNDFNQNNQNEQNNQQQGFYGNGQQQGNFYNPNGQQGNFYNPNGQQGYYNPNMQGFYDPNMQRQAEAAKKASNAKTLGIVALITSFVCTGLIPIILGIIALTTASSAKSLIGYDLPDAKTGRSLGIASLIVTGVIYLLFIAFYVIVILVLGETLYY